MFCIFVMVSILVTDDNYCNISELVAQLRRENNELRTKLDKTEETLEVGRISCSATTFKLFIN